MLRRAAAAGGVLVAGGGLAAGLPELGSAATSPALDRRILSFLLDLEYLQEAFYREARAEGKLTGELRQFAEVAGKDERAHVALLRKALGNRARASPKFDFGRATTDPRTFRTRAAELEELVTAAYIGQGANLSTKHVTKATRIASVDARHAAWIRDIVGKHPAPRAADHAVSAARVQKSLRKLGFVVRS
jgi:ferritin-like protein